MDFLLSTFFYEVLNSQIFGSNMGDFMSGMFYMGFVFLMTLGLLSLGMAVGQKWRYEVAKLTAFECGFDPLSSSRMPFSMRFFLVALLFLVFDVEMVLLFPYIISLKMIFLSMSVFSKCMCFVFLLILIGGLMHEINEGSLEWKY
uniref:NADH-ubiquinone oxidoreductase chain 3 n=1 Tax=Meretrix lamarckii TaxID=157363 RepID=G8A430_9BIVA|nr:NADH dehydrogenase subunit 3 [Meretrix lamarckii]ACY06187.1 NADH dehydrogenase subunit 3 [Meretrix lamarckii]